MNSEPIKLININKKYKVENNDIIVFDNLNMEIDPSETTVITGKSGCGKTTLLRLLAGLESPDSGKIVIPDNLHIGMMFQEARLMPWLTCEKNVTLGMKKNSGRDALRVLEMVGLKGFKKAYPSQLSGGMKQRAALARTLLRKSNLILMDEPFAALDNETRKAMQKELLRIKEETNAGIIFVTHDSAEAEFLGDRIITIKQRSSAESFE